jgi:hypothetical protein
MSYLGLISIVYAWCGLLFLIYKWPGNKSMTFSQHAAQYRASRVYYRVFWLSALVPFFWFITTSYANKLGLSVAFDMFAVIATGLLVIAALIAEVGGRRTTIHRLAAFSNAAFLVPLVVLSIMSENISNLARVAGTLVAAYMLYIIYFLTKHKRQHSKMLYMQGSYILIFHVFLLVAFYS